MKQFNILTSVHASATMGCHYAGCRRESVYDTRIESLGYVKDDLYVTQTLGCVEHQTALVDSCLEEHGIILWEPNETPMEMKIRRLAKCHAFPGNTSPPPQAWFDLYTLVGREPTEEHTRDFLNEWKKLTKTETDK